jgi:CheY-like chemotaxis protein
MACHALSVAKTMTVASAPAGYATATSPHGDSPLGILLVEDEASDALLAEAALDDADLDYEMRTLQDGQEVLPYLYRQGKYRDERRPDIMFLDLSLPTKDGFEVLADLAEQPGRFGDLPIVILTGDTHCAFLKQSYGLKIAAFLAKPCTAEKINAAMAAIWRQ